jgi:endonuclease/exonuclease/phosphatase family metal-dependent hydrolase
MSTSGTTTGSQGSFVVVTWNAGTGGSNGTNNDGDGYNNAQADASDEHYGNGLAWIEAVDVASAWFAALQPDVVALQEVFYPGDCAEVPADQRAGFICETWQPGDPTVVERLLGPSYQIACHIGAPDKCVAVKKSFGAIRDCAADLCLDGLDGGFVDGCGQRSRVGRAVVDLAGGGTLTVASIHGSSGILPADQQCRVAQIDQVFVDLRDGSGAGAANGERNVVLGDFNTDPARLTVIDASARRLNELVGGANAMQWVTEVGANATPTYTGGLNIDHVASDAFTGSCVVAGVTPGEPAVYPYAMFDHRPHVCTVGEL